MSAVIRLDADNIATLQKDLAQLPQKMVDGAKERLDQGGDFFVVIAQSYCLVDTGTLQGSVRKEWHGDVLRIIAGGSQFINPKTNKPCDYAVYVERKNPFMRPAWETVRHTIMEDIKQGVLEAVSK